MQSHLAIGFVAAPDNIALIKCSIHHSVLRPLRTKLLPIEGSCNLMASAQQIRKHTVNSRTEWVMRCRIREWHIRTANSALPLYLIKKLYKISCNDSERQQVDQCKELPSTVHMHLFCFGKCKQLMFNLVRDIYSAYINTS